jgi:hypothetical protein
MEANRINYKLRDKDIQKASALFGIDELIIRRMNDQCLLNAEYIRDLLIKSDYERLTNGLRYLIDQKNAYTFPEIKAALKKEYCISMQTLNSILHGRNNSNLCFCTKCGMRTSSLTYKRTGGLCSNCFAETLEL